MELPVDPRAWKTRGLCHDHADPDLWFPDERTSQAAVQRAKDICHQCPVEGECLEYATANVERAGIWGGTSERERRAVRKGRKVFAHGTRSRYMQGCTCAECRQANTAYQKLHAARPAVAGQADPSWMPRLELDSIEAL